MEQLDKKITFEDEVTVNDPLYSSLATTISASGFQAGYDQRPWRAPKKDDLVSSKHIDIFSYETRRTGIFGLNKEAEWIGRLYLNDPYYGARENCRWVLDVHGRKNIPVLTELAK